MCAFYMLGILYSKEKFIPIQNLYIKAELTHLYTIYLQKFIS